MKKMRLAFTPLMEPLFAPWITMLAVMGGSSLFRKTFTPSIVIVEPGFAFAWAMQYRKFPAVPLPVPVRKLPLSKGVLTV